MTRRTNISALKRYLARVGEQAKAQLSLDAKISLSLIDKLLADSYPTVPRMATRERICTALGMPEDEVFPLVEADGKTAS